MDSMTFPEIFEGHVMGFFTDRRLGVDVEPLTGRKVYFPTQSHSDTVKVLASGLRPAKADAVITCRRDILLGVKTADCVPILLHDWNMSVIGAVHAGWKGTAKGILKKTIKKMKEKFNSRPGDILVAIGPAIKWCCYEVGEDVAKAVARATGDGDYCRTVKGKHLLDLQSSNIRQAIAMGINERNISLLEECTHCSSGKYHSYRQARGEAGRQGGFIGFP
jgi:YfiH family protein